MIGPNAGNYWTAQTRGSRDTHFDRLWDRLEEVNLCTSVWPLRDLASFVLT